jgi:linoleate 9S-lipoxygenase
MPVPGTKEYAELERRPEKVFLRTITSQLHALAGISLLEVL